MALMDRAIQVQATPGLISEAIKASLNSNDQPIVSHMALFGAFQSPTKFF
jgi:hypothetical protein